MRDGVGVVSERIEIAGGIPWIENVPDAGAGVDGAGADSGLIGNLDLVLCGAGIYAQQDRDRRAGHHFRTDFLRINLSLRPRMCHL